MRRLALQGLGLLCLLSTHAPSTHARLRPDGTPREDVSVGYNSATGEVWVDVPLCNLTSVNIASKSGIFTNHAAVHNLGGSFDEHALTVMSVDPTRESFTFGRVARPGLNQDFLLDDLSVVGSWIHGSLGDVNLIYIPEPSAIVLTALGFPVLLPYVLRRTRD